MQSTSTRTFDFSNWATPQSVAIVGQEDTLADGNQTYRIRATSQSDAAAYDNKTASLAFTSVDNEQGSGECAVAGSIHIDDFE